MRSPDDPAARRLDVDHDVVLLRIEAVIDPADLGDGCRRLPSWRKPGQLVAADDVAFGLDLHEGDVAVLHQHQIRETRRACRGNPGTSRERSWRCPPRSAPVSSAAARRHRHGPRRRCRSDGPISRRSVRRIRWKRASGSNGLQLVVDLGGKPTREAPVLQAMRHPIETAVKLRRTRTVRPRTATRTANATACSPRRRPGSALRAASRRRRPLPDCRDRCRRR